VGFAPARGLTVLKSQPDQPFAQLSQYSEIAVPEHFTYPARLRMITSELTIVAAPLFFFLLNAGLLVRISK
jgi:hypothetical protein